MTVTPNGGDVPSETVDRGGRPPGRALTARETRTVRNLLTAKQHADDQKRRARAELEDYVLELRGSGASNRGIAQALGVSPATVQTWISNAIRRRGE